MQQTAAAPSYCRIGVNDAQESIGGAFNHWPGWGDRLHSTGVKRDFGRFLERQRHFVSCLVLLPYRLQSSYRQLLASLRAGGVLCRFWRCEVRLSSVHCRGRKRGSLEPRARCRSNRFPMILPIVQWSLASPALYELSSNVSSILHQRHYHIILSITSLQKILYPLRTWV
jgi:hypothetical protein